LDEKGKTRVTLAQS